MHTCKDDSESLTLCSEYATPIVPSLVWLPKYSGALVTATIKIICALQFASYRHDSVTVKTAGIITYTIRGAIFSIDCIIWHHYGMHLLSDPVEWILTTVSWHHIMSYSLWKIAEKLT